MKPMQRVLLITLQRYNLESMEADALRTPLGISLPISLARTRFLRRVKAGSEHLPDNSMALGSSPCLPEPGGKFPTDFRGWN